MGSGLLSQSQGGEEAGGTALDPTLLGKEKDPRQLASAVSLVLFAAMRAPQDR